MKQEGIGFTGALLRIALAIALVLVTINPSGHSFWHWIAPVFPKLQALQVLAAIVLVICWSVYVTATLRSLGLLGVTLMLALFAAIVWVVVQQGWLHLDSSRVVAWIVLLAAGLILGIGMCWSFVRRRLSGQTDVDEVDHR